MYRPSYCNVQIKQRDATLLMNDLYYSLFGCTCFGLSPVHHQEHHLIKCITHWYIRDGDGEIKRRGRVLIWWMILFTRCLFYASTTLVAPGVLLVEVPRPHCVRHTKFDRIPVDEWSAQRRDLYMTTHNTHKRQTFMPPEGFEPAIQASELV